MVVDGKYLPQLVIGHEFIELVFHFHTPSIWYGAMVGVNVEGNWCFHGSVAWMRGEGCIS
jgi:hypothetical protein